MTSANPGAAGMPEENRGVLDALGDKSWRARLHAVERLASEDSPLLISQVVEIVRSTHRDLSRLNSAIQVLTRTEGDVIPSLLPLLSSSDADVRAYCALILGERGDPRAIPALLDALQDRDTNVRVHAVEALGKLQAAEAVDSLLAFVQSLEFELAFPAIDALMAIRDERAAYHLIPLLQNPLLKTTVVEALGVLGDEEAVIALLSRLADSAVPPAAVAKAIRQIHDRQLQRYGSGEAIAALIRHAEGPASVAVFRTAIPVSPVADISALIAVIGWLSGEEADWTLLDLLDTPDLRRFALDALAARGAAIMPAVLQRFANPTRESLPHLIDLCGRIADRRAVPQLLKCLRSDDSDVVAKSLESLARIGDQQAYAAAKTFLGHDDARVRQAAVSVLNSLGHPDTAQDIEQLLRNPSALVCDSALRVAAYFGFPECCEAVLACCEHPDDHVRRTAIEHLPCLEDERVVERLGAALASDNATLRAAAAGALGEVEPGYALPLLQSALNDSDVWVRYYAIRSLARSDYPLIVNESLLSMARSDPAMQVRIAAVEALRAEALPTLVELAGSDEDDLAAAALAALGATRHPGALPTLISAAASDNPRLQLQAIAALGDSGLPAAVAPLEAAAQGRRQALAEEAISALGCIALAESVAALLKVMELAARRSASMAALISLGDFIVPLLAHRLHQLPLDVRRTIVEVLVRIGSRQALSVLETMLADAEPSVRHASLAALAHARRLGQPDGSRSADPSPRQANGDA